MTTFQDGNVKIYQKIVKEKLGRSMKNHFSTWTGTFESRL